MRGDASDTVIGGRLGLTVREAGVADLPQIEAVARYSFPIPGWIFSFEGNLARYQPGGVPPGTRIRVALDAAGRIVTYVYYSFPAAGRVHIGELAACPPPPAAKVKGAAALLLRLTGEDAFACGAPAVSLNVSAPHRVDVPGLWRNPCGFYYKFGFEELSCPVLYEPGDPPYFSGDAHMRAGTRRLLRLTGDYLLSQQPTDPTRRIPPKEISNGFELQTYYSGVSQQ